MARASRSVGEVREDAQAHPAAGQLLERSGAMASAMVLTALAPMASPTSTRTWTTSIGPHGPCPAADAPRCRGRRRRAAPCCGCTALADAPAARRAACSTRRGRGGQVGEPDELDLPDHQRARRPRRRSRRASRIDARGVAGGGDDRGLLDGHRHQIRSRPLMRKLRPTPSGRPTRRRRSPSCGRPLRRKRGRGLARISRARPPSAGSAPPVVQTLAPGQAVEPGDARAVPVAFDCLCRFVHRYSSLLDAGADSPRARFARRRKPPARP